MILVIRNFSELLPGISPKLIHDLKSYIKHSKECFFFTPLSSFWKWDETLFIVFSKLGVYAFSEVTNMANVTPPMFCHCGKAQHHSYVECNVHVKFKYLKTTSSLTSTD